MRILMQSAVLATCIVAALATSASTVAMEPMYTSTSSQQRGTGPADSARPGEMFFGKDVTAVAKKDYKFAVQMYQTSASWAYKPAQYNLGVIYSTGEGGVAADRALGMAWLALAAERGDADYVAARDSAYTRMSDEEFEHANELWREMKKTYGDEVALKRAERRWRQVRNEATGSHVGGGTGPLAVGGRDKSGMNVVSDPRHPTTPAANTSTQSAFGITGAGAADGSVAYRQLRESDNPYDAKFAQPTGTVKVLDIIPIGESVKRKPANGREPPHFY